MWQRALAGRDETVTPDAAAIAAQLSGAQRAWIGKLACWKQPALGHPPRWMTFPPANTHRVLIAKALCDRSGQISKLGLAIRAHLLETQHG